MGGRVRPLRRDRGHAILPGARRESTYIEVKFHLGGKHGRGAKNRNNFIEEGFPLPTVPTIFCDGIANLAPSPHVVKVYLFRQDPDQTGKPKYKSQILAQVVMPVPAFVYAGLLFEKALNQFVAQGTIPQETVAIMHLTNKEPRRSDWCASGLPDAGASEIEIEISPAMMAAGAEAVWEFRGFDPNFVAEKVFWQW